jgi:parallel beta-helix repeat protein
MAAFILTTMLILNGSASPFSFTNSAIAQVSITTYTIVDNATGGDCNTIGSYSTVTKTCTLSRNLTGEAIIIDSDNITLNCNYHIITANLGAGGGGDGVLVEDNNGITVNLCTIDDFDKGVHLVGSDSGRIENNNFTNNHVQGILAGGANHIIRFNSFTGNDFPVQLSGVENAIISANIAAVNQQGIVIFGGGQNMIDNNFLGGSGTFGLLLTQGSSENSVLNNYLSGNDEDGLVIQDSSDSNIVRDNVFEFNGDLINAFGTGVSIIGSSHNVVQNNRLEFNGLNGIFMSEGCFGNVITDNNVTFSGADGILVSDCTNNRI